MRPRTMMVMPPRTFEQQFGSEERDLLASVADLVTASPANSHPVRRGAVSQPDSTCSRSALSASSRHDVASLCGAFSFMRVHRAQRLRNSSHRDYRLRQYRPATRSKDTLLAQQLGGR